VPLAFGPVAVGAPTKEEKNKRGMAAPKKKEPKIVKLKALGIGQLRLNGTEMRNYNNN